MGWWGVGDRMGGEEAVGGMRSVYFGWRECWEEEGKVMKDKKGRVYE